MNKDKVSCVFNSMYGYSSLLRVGKVYIINKIHYVFLLITHEDLIDYKNILNRFFNLCKYKLKIKILKRYLSFKDLHDRQLGLCNINYLMEKYYRKHFKKK